jgi:hypothetical protein
LVPLNPVYVYCSKFSYEINGDESRTLDYCINPVVDSLMLNKRKYPELGLLPKPF